MTTGVFTTIKVIQGIPLFFEQHKNRLIQNATALKLGKITLSLNEIKNYFKENNLTDCALKIIITKEKNKAVVTIEHRPLPPSDTNIKLITINDTRNKNKIYKTTDRTINDQIKKYAKENDGDDAVFVENNNLIESTIANIFSLNKNGDVITPPLDNRGLKGITRKIIMENLPVIEEEIPADTTQPIVLTNSLRIQKATHLNGRKLQNAEQLFQKIKTVLQQEEQQCINKQGVTKKGPRAKKIIYKTLPSWFEPEQVFLKLFSDLPSYFWLDSSLTNDTSRFSYMGIPQEIIIYSLKQNTVTINKNNKTKKIEQTIFDFLEQHLAEKEIENTKLPFDFIGGYIGYFGYELKKLTGSKKAFTSPYPDSLWFYTEKTIVFDHKEKKVYLVCLSENKTTAEEWFSEIEKKLKHIGYPELFSESHNQNIIFKLDRNYNKYLKDIAVCQQHLQSGESYQICLTNEFSAKGRVNPLELYLKLRQTNPAPYAAFIKYNDLAILSSSPEEFLRVDKNYVETKPIKGTIRRGEYPEEDKVLIKQLSESKKDWSENAMIVDLLRNDLGKICEFGSVKVTKLMDIESFQTVHQLVSTVTGTLRKDNTIIDCVKAAFPGGSMTGAPKIHTMEIIDNLEKKSRGIYSGSMGFLSLNKKALLNIVIRTIIIDKDHLSIGAGGAILTDSDPKNECEEMMLKANVLKQTVTSLYNPTMHTVFLALGSNVGNKKENLNKAIKLLGKQIKNISVAKFYETKPMYYEKQENFLNSALRGETDLSPRDLLTFVKSLEQEIGRKKRFPNGPREIDIDILFYDDISFQDEHVQIPHPRIQERDFVLKPLMDIDPNFIHPVLKKTIKELENEI